MSEFETGIKTPLNIKYEMAKSTIEKKSFQTYSGYQIFFNIVID